MTFIYRTKLIKNNDFKKIQYSAGSMEMLQPCLCGLGPLKRWVVVLLCERDILMEVPVLKQARNRVVKNEVSENTTVGLHQILQKTFESHQNINTLAQAYIAWTI